MRAEWALMGQPAGDDRWSREVRARWPWAVVALLGVLGVAMVVSGPVAVRAMGAAFVLAAAGVALFGRVVVEAGADGLTVRFGWWRWPAVHVAIGRIAAAEVVDVRPMRWGGWGYRGSLTVFRRAAVVLRGGDGVQATLRDGRVFVVTTDDAAGAVRALRRAMADPT